jgi:hypothetical protein
MHFITYDQQQWTVTGLARRYGLPPSTLRHRVERFGATATGIQRALATGIMTREQAGRRGAERSCWRYPD